MTDSVPEPGEGESESENFPIDDDCGAHSKSVGPMTPNDSAEPLSDEEIAKWRAVAQSGSAAGEMAGEDLRRMFATIDALTERAERAEQNDALSMATRTHLENQVDALTARVKELEGNLANLEADERICGHAKALATAQHRYRDLETAARECVDAAKDLRKYVSPDSGCGYFTYKRIWDSSMQAETHFVHALAALSDKEETNDN